MGDILYVFGFKVTHPNLTPETGVVEVEAPNAADAIVALATKMPGIHIHKLEYSWRVGTEGTA